MTVEIISVQPTELKSYYSAIVNIYESVFTLPPYNEPHAIVRQFARELPQQMKRPGLKMQLALDGEVPVGMAYGCTCSEEQWFYAVVTQGMSSSMSAIWFEYAFEVIELALKPEYHGLGIGSQLHDTLLTDLPHKTAVLSTVNAETPARHLYRKRGWQPIRDKFIFPNVEREYLILGVQLPLF